MRSRLDLQRLAGRRCYRLSEPAKVGLAGGIRSEDEELRDFVRVEVADSVFDLVEMGCGGFDKEQGFFGCFDFSLPTINGGQARDDVDAGSEVFLHEGAGDLFGFVAGGRSGEDEAYIGGGYNHRWFGDELLIWLAAS